MAELYLVRHGQASFGTDDYDRLSPLGWQQSRWLGEHLAARGVRVARAVTGTLRRQRETLAALLEGMTGHYGAVATSQHDGLNEYEGRRILEAQLGSIDEAGLARDRRAYFKTLREALYAWSEGALAVPGHPTFADFRRSARAAVDAACAVPPEEGIVLIVSSGGPIASIVGSVLQSPPRVTIDLNLQARNTGLSQFAFNRRSLQLVSFNATPHLDRPDRLDAITYA